MPRTLEVHVKTADFPVVVAAMSAAADEIERLTDALGLLRGYVAIGSEGWQIINDALGPKLFEARDRMDPSKGGPPEQGASPEPEAP